MLKWLIAEAKRDSEYHILRLDQTSQRVISVQWRQVTFFCLLKYVCFCTGWCRFILCFCFWISGHCCIFIVLFLFLKRHFAAITAPTWRSEGALVPFNVMSCHVMSRMLLAVATLAQLIGSRTLESKHSCSFTVTLRQHSCVKSMDGIGRQFICSCYFSVHTFPLKDSVEEKEKMELLRQTRQQFKRDNWRCCAVDIKGRQQLSALVGDMFRQKMSAGGICEMSEGLKCGGASWSLRIPDGRHHGEPALHCQRVDCDAHLCLHCVWQEGGGARWQCGFLQMIQGARSPKCADAREQSFRHFQTTWGIHFIRCFITPPQYPQEIKSNHAVKHIHIQPWLFCS